MKRFVFVFSQHHVIGINAETKELAETEAQQIVQNEKLDRCLKFSELKLETQRELQTK